MTEHLKEIQEALRLMDTYSKTQLAIGLASLKMDTGFSVPIYVAILKAMDRIKGINRKTLVKIEKGQTKIEQAKKRSRLT